jgi:hypothetical protein
MLDHVEKGGNVESTRLYGGALLTKVATIKRGSRSAPLRHSHERSMPLNPRDAITEPRQMRGYTARAAAELQDFGVPGHTERAEPRREDPIAAQVPKVRLFGRKERLYVLAVRDIERWVVRRKAGSAVEKLPLGASGRFSWPSYARRFTYVIALSTLAVLALTLVFELVLVCSIAMGLLVSHGAGACERGLRAAFHWMIRSKTRASWAQELPLLRDDLLTPQTERAFAPGEGAEQP